MRIVCTFRETPYVVLVGVFAIDANFNDLPQNCLDCRLDLSKIRATFTLRLSRTVSSFRDVQNAN